ncbi:MAG: hypothetical protein NTW09_00895 [Candidatus Omnitrophica bacterium]|nr:hypothetical protein [Candidatus Omnitrophota bacterium]
MKRSLVVLTLIAALTLIAIPVFSQESKEPAPAPTPAETAPLVTPAEPANEAVLQPEEMSIYGEVKSTDEAANSIKLQYYDYDNDEEKTADIVIDKDTKMENAASLKDIKQGDWIDAVYLPKDGFNIAKSVIVEKEEEEAPPAAMPEEDKAAEQPVETPSDE